MNRCPLCGSETASGHGCSTVPPEDLAEHALAGVEVEQDENGMRWIRLRTPAEVGKPVKRRG